MCVRHSRSVAIFATLIVAITTTLAMRQPGRPRWEATSRASAIERSTRRETMLMVLGARGPHASLGADAHAFDQLVGHWDADFSFHGSDGTVRHKRGEVLFGWVLDGHAVQDVWITYPSPGEHERRIGTTIRVFDRAAKQWRVVFVQPQFNYIVTVQGPAEGNRIVLNGFDRDSQPIRWSFNDITNDSFVWRGEKSHDRGKSWQLEEEHHMRRRLR
jgi:uncharacterized protein